MKNTIYFEREWLEIISGIEQSKQNELLAAVMRYQLNGEMPSFQPTMMALFRMIKLQLDRRRQRLDKNREKRKPDSVVKPSETVRTEASVSADVSVKKPVANVDKDKIPVPSPKMSPSQNVSQEKPKTVPVRPPVNSPSMPRRNGLNI